MPLIHSKFAKYALLFAFHLPAFLSAQTFSLTVANGYGSGSFRAGDTVHIWSKAIPANAIFNQWVGDIATVSDQNAWHSTLVMPGANISVAATYKAVTPWTLNNELIQGADTLKQVYWYFPAPTKGVMYFFHGTNGSATNFATNVEVRQLMNAAVADSFGVIVTESEESTKHRDLNGDGVWRWFPTPVDSTTNIDMRNIKALTDTFIARGRFTHATKRYSLGYSNGGFFSQTVSGLFRFTAAVSFCGQGIDSFFSIGTTPFHWCMGKYDHNPNVGQQGNAQAYQSYLTLLSRGICAEYYVHDRSPLYRQRFMRITGIDSLLSLNISAELYANNILDSAGYFRFDSDSIETLALQNPTSYPVLRSLTSAQRSDVSDQIDVSCAGHQVYSEITKDVLSFLDRLCSVTTDVNSSVSSVAPKEFSLHQNYPNPFNPSTSITYHLPFQGHVTLKVYDVLGREVKTLVNENLQAGSYDVTFDATGLSSGVYLYRLQSRSFVKTKKMMLLR